MSLAFGRDTMCVKYMGKISTNHELKSFKLKITKMVSMKGGSRSFKVVEQLFSDSGKVVH